MQMQSSINKAWLKKIFSSKVRWREILAVLILVLIIVFFCSEKKELLTIIPNIKHASPLWLVTGLGVTILYIFLQAGIYKKSFAAISLFVQWGKAVVLFLKRNFIGIFLPAGSVSALAYSPSQIRRSGFKKMQVHQASGLFGLASLLTVFVAGFPVILFTIVNSNQFKNAWIAWIAVLPIISLLFFPVRSIKKRGKLFAWIDKKFPSFTPTIHELSAVNVNRKQFSGAIFYSLGVELCGMLHVYIAMLALGVPSSFGVSATAYIIAVLMMVISPFLKGLGAVELSMVYVLEQFGYNATQAISITLLYRIFEFWLPLLAGFLAFAWKGRQLFFRVAPALLIFALGLVNIVSAVTPPLFNRLHLLQEYLPLAAIHASHLLVLFMGLTLLVTSVFLFRGSRNAWMIALILSILSLIGHLIKALDYEEAIVAAITVIVLVSTSSQYRIRSSRKWMQAGLKTALINVIAVVLFGFISFYFIDKKHFGVDFTWQQSLLHTLKCFLLTGDTTLHPITRFGHEFIWIIRASGFFTWALLLFALIKPHIKKHTVSESYREKAKFLLSQFGSSSIDYFKICKDKLFFFSYIHEAFIAYRIAGGFAIVLAEPVCAEEHKVEVLQEFDRYCRKIGLKPAFYRVSENSILWFNQINKHKLIIGQEAILSINNFSLEGKDKKSLRNGLNGLRKKGYTVAVHSAPHSADFLFQIRKVSDEWLKSFGKKELIFSQGIFDEKELRQQDIITLSDAEGAIKSFLNIIPNYTEDECTYDLIRKTNDAPGAAMDALIIKLIEFAKAHNKQYLNLGLVPMSGPAKPDNTAEQIIKWAATKIKRFQHYKGLKEFKEKYATLWENKYLVYDNDFDLLLLPIALNNVMKP